MLCLSSRLARPDGGPPAAGLNDPQRLSLALAGAGAAAKRIAARLRLPAEDRADLRQDLLVALLTKAAFYNPARDAWTTFADRVLRGAACDLQRRWGRISARRPLPLDAVADPAFDPTATLERRIALTRLAERLPADLLGLWILRLTDGPGAIPPGLSAATAARRLRALRRRAEDTDVAPSSAAGRGHRPHRGREARP